MPLLRIHGQRLARADPEERGVEAGGAVEEAAVPGHRGARMIGVGVVQVGRPPAVGRQAAHGVGPRQHQPPQVPRRADTSGVAAGGADDDDRIVGGRGDRGGLRSVVAGEHCGEPLRRRLVEDDGRGQADPGGVGDPVTQLDSGQRVEAEVAEGRVGAERGGVGITQDVGGQRADQFHRSGRGEVGRCARLRLGRADELGQQRRRTASGEGRVEGGPVHVGENDDGVGATELAQQRPGGPVGIERAQAHPAQPGQLPRVVRHADPGPRAPGDGGGVQSASAARMGDAVQGGVRGGVGALVAASPDTRDGGEQHERVHVTDQLVEQAGTGDLGVQDLGQLRGFEGVGGGAGAPDARRVDDDGRRVLVQHGPERVAVGDVGPYRDHLRAESGVIEHAGTAGENDLRRTPQVPGHGQAESSGAAGDQHGGPVDDGPAARMRGRDDACCQQGVAEGDLVFAGGHRGAHPGGVRLARGVDQAAPALGLLQCDDAAESPDGGLVRIGDLVADAYGVAGQAPDAFAGRDVAQCGEEVGGGPARHVEDGAVGGPVRRDLLPHGDVAPGVAAAAHPAGRHPVPVPLERVRGQFDHLCARVDRAPVEGHAPGPQRRERAQQGLDLVDTLAKRRDHAVHEGDERGFGPDLEDVGGVECGRAVGEPHGVADVADPVSRLGGVGLARDPHELDPGPLTRHRRNGLREGVQDLVHVGGVERVADLQRRHLHAVLAIGLHQPGDGVRVTGHRHRVGAVDGREFHAVRQPHVVLGHRDGRHRPGPAHGVHQRAPLDHESRRVLQREHPGRPGGGDLPHRMPDHHVRRDLPRLQQSHQSDLEREDSRLRVPGLVQPLAVGDRVPHLGREQVQHLVPRSREHREPFSEAAAHPGPLRPLTGEHERDPARSRRGDPACRPQPLDGLVDRSGHDGDPVIERRPRRPQ